MILKREKDVKAYEKKVKHQPLEPGDTVYEEIPDALRNKLQPKWVKMEVVERHTGPKGDTGTTYDCQRPDGSKTDNVFDEMPPLIPITPSPSSPALSTANLSSQNPSPSTSRPTSTPPVQLSLPPPPARFANNDRNYIHIIVLLAGLFEVSELLAVLKPVREVVLVVQVLLGVRAGGD